MNFDFLELQLAGFDAKIVVGYFEMVCSCCDDVIFQREGGGINFVRLVSSPLLAHSLLSQD